MKTTLIKYTILPLAALFIVVSLVSCKTETFTLTYVAGEGGIIEGNKIQEVKKGQNGTKVTAKQNDGFDFVRWQEDNKTDHERTEKNVKSSKTFTAVFNLASMEEQIAIKEYKSGFGVFGLLTDDHRLFMWGTNRFGQIGNGEIGFDLVVRTPIEITIPDEKPQTLSLGRENSGVITETGKVYLWGSNNNGQLGTGDTDNRSIPTLNTTLDELDDTIVALEINKFYTAQNNNRVIGVLTENKDLYLWGGNAYGQQGTGSSGTGNVLLPTKVNLENFSSPKQFSIGGGHVGYIGEDDEVYMWGYNDYGQIGNNSITSISTPTKILLDGEKPEKLKLGDHDSTVITESGKLFAWGRITNNRTPQEIEIAPGETAKTIEISYSNLLVNTLNDKLYIYGTNYSGQYGNGNKITISNYQFVLINLPANKIPKFIVTNSSTGGGNPMFFASFISQNNELYMWGSGLVAGEEDYSEHLTPTKINFDLT